MGIRQGKPCRFSMIFPPIQLCPILEQLEKGANLEPHELKRVSLPKNHSTKKKKSDASDIR